MSDESGLADCFDSGRFGRAINSLLEANDYARRVASDPWEFAINIRQLRALNLTENDLRLLVRLKYLDHAREVTTFRDYRRVFLATRNMSFSKRTCFVLTRSGIAAIKSAITFRDKRHSELRPPDIAGGKATLNADLPEWDSQIRTLSFAGQLVKRLKRQAINQERVLLAFQEENWPRRILDPLVPQPCQDMKRRLNDTIKCLNRGQQRRLLYFRGDGTGEGVTWEFVG